MGSQKNKQDSRERLTRRVAHDINNALTGTFGHLQSLALQFGEGSKEKHKIEKALTGLMHISSLVRDLEDPNTKTPEKTSRCSLDSTLKNTCELFEGVARSGITFQWSADTPAILYGEPQKIQRAVMNLLINAQEAIPEKGTITVSVKLDSDRAHITVSDNGSGISKEDVKNIFKEGYSTKQKKTRSGFGLSNVKEIMDELGGEVTVNSEQRSGSTFTLTFPIITTKQSNSKKQGSVLIVDDSQIALEALSTYLTEVGFDVRAFDNWDESVTWFETNSKSTDLVFLDMQLGTTSATELFPIFRTISEQVPIVISSGEHNAEINELLDKGALHFFKKPFDYNDAAQKISTLLGRPPAQPEKK